MPASSSGPVPDAAGPTPGAGGVVLDGAGGVLLVRYRSGAWAFPKGHVEAGETLEQTAVREVREETGVTAVPLAPLPETRYTNDRGEARVIHWFVMRPQESGPEESAPTALEETFPEGGFFPAQAAAGMLTYPEDQALLRAALARTSGTGGR